MSKIFIVLLTFIMVSCLSSKEDFSVTKKFENDNIRMAKSAVLRSQTKSDKYGKKIPAGTQVVIDVNCIRSSNGETIVELILPENLTFEDYPGGCPVIGGSLIKSGNHIYMKPKGKYRVKGIIVEEGRVSFMKYFIYVESYQKL